MSDIKILISCHKESEHPQGTFLIPIQVGAANAKVRFPEMLHDDEGENISAKNPLYCELTAQYWAWKNLDADYYGFCHYRRYFNFSGKTYEEDRWGNIEADFMDQKAIRMFGLDDDSIRRAVEGYDIVTTSRKNLRRMPERYASVNDQYQKAKRLHARDLQTVLEIIDEKYPQYSAAARRHCQGHVTSFCNMYILRKEIFFDYCAWLFDILAEFERRTDMSLYSREALRTPGHLSERLFGIYYLALSEQRRDLKVGEVQCVLFGNTDPQPMLKPAFAQCEVPVVLAANNNFVPMVATCICSVLDHASAQYNYDLVLLESDITLENKEILLKMVEKCENVSLRFFNAVRLLSGYELKANAHISVETYFRFLIQDILPDCDQVLYLDCDLVAQDDVAKLYHTDLGNALLGAARDPDFLGQINGANPLTLKYCQTELPLKDPYHYFQAGVLLLNTAAMRKAYSLEQWLTFATHPYKYNDQDVLNLYCEGRVLYLDMAWNLLTDCDHYRVPNVITYAPEAVYKEYMQARSAPKMIHYAGFMKPWHRPDEDMAAEFWMYARRTPFYEQLLFRMNEASAWHVAYGLDRQKGWGKRLLGFPRRVIDRCWPKGSSGREKLKRVYHLFVKAEQ
ncbi:MAG: DUF4422 domain-containing protein [Oscillospiraceae bacterium]